MTDGYLSEAWRVPVLEKEVEALEEKIDELQKALVEVVLPLEVIAGQDRMKPYKELSRDLIEQIYRSIATVRSALKIE